MESHVPIVYNLNKFESLTVVGKEVSVPLKDTPLLKQLFYKMNIGLVGKIFETLK